MSESVNKELYAAEIAKEIVVAIVDRHGFAIVPKDTPTVHAQAALEMFEIIYQGVLKTITRVP